jgi:hypothetical protein
VIRRCHFLGQFFDQRSQLVVGLIPDRLAQQWAGFDADDLGHDTQRVVHFDHRTTHKDTGPRNLSGIAQPAGIDGDTLTLRVWDYHLEAPAAWPQPFDVKWQLKAPIRPDRAGSAVIHAHAPLVTSKDGKLIRTVSLFLRLIDKETPHRSQLLFVRSTDGGKTWPDPPRLVADDVRWPAAPLRPVCFHPGYEGEIRERADHVICLAMDEDDRAVFFRTHDGGVHWNKEAVRLPDPETGKSVPGIPLASPNPGLTLVYAIPAGDSADRIYRLCHAWAGHTARLWSGATTIASNLSLPDRQLFSIRASTSVGVMAVTCPVARDRAEEPHMDLLLSIDEWRRVWRALRLDEQLVWNHRHEAPCPTASSGLCLSRGKTD